jgi:hypothetical protein
MHIVIFYLWVLCCRNTVYFRYLFPLSFFRIRCLFVYVSSMSTCSEKERPAPHHHVTVSIVWQSFTATHHYTVSPTPLRVYPSSYAARPRCSATGKSEQRNLRSSRSRTTTSSIVKATNPTFLAFPFPGTSHSQHAELHRAHPHHSPRQTRQAISYSHHD